MKSHLLSNSIIFLCISSLLCAQENSSLDKIKRHLPTNKEGIENTARLAREAAKPLKAEVSAALKAKRERAADLRHGHAEFLAQVADGSVIANGDFISKHSQLKERALKLKSLHDVYLSQVGYGDSQSDHDFQKQAPELLAEIHQVLSPIADYLMDATPRRVSLEQTSLSESQLVELMVLNKDSRLPSESSKSMLTVRTPQSVTTLIYVPVPIELSAPPSSEIYLEALAGGRFSNGLPMQKLIVGQSGKVQTYWYSVGESTSVSSLKITSPQCMNQTGVNITVVDPMIRPLPALPDPTTRSLKLPAATLPLQPAPRAPSQ